MCATQFSHGSVLSLWSYGPLILQKWAKNVNKVNNVFILHPIYLMLIANMDLEWQLCKTKFSHGSFLSLRSYVPLILQNWPNMLVHKQLRPFLPYSFDTCHKLISGVVYVYRAISARVSMVIVELWPFNIVFILFCEVQGP